MLDAAYVMMLDIAHEADAFLAQQSMLGGEDKPHFVSDLMAALHPEDDELEDGPEDTNVVDLAAWVSKANTVL